MTIRATCSWFAAGAVLVACSPGGGRPAAAQSTKPGPSDDAGASSGGTQGNPETGAASSNSQLSFTLQNSSRHGDALLFNVQGNDPTGQTSEAQVQLLDAKNAPVVAFDTNWDGKADSAEQRLHFDQSTLGQKIFQATITLPHLYAAEPSIASAVVSLSDAHGNLSPSVTVALQPQAVRHQGSPCDTLSITDRCTESLSCSGKPATCQVAEAPSLTRVAYYGDENPSELFLGADPAEDLASLLVTFLDGNGKPLIVDLSGDGAGEPASSVLVDARGATGQSFFFENDPSETFASAVSKISVTPTDAFGKSGTPVIATRTTQPVIASGMSCDPYGFAACATGTACSPGLVGMTNRCTAISSLQAAKCSAAPQADTSGLLAGWGLVAGVSLWDPPAGCASSAAVGRPESVVMLKLAHPTDSLTISTAVPETDFDTVLYVLPDCATSSTDALGCNDDAQGQGYASTVTLTNVAAGTYAIVIDSATSRSGHFGLSVKAE